MTEALAKKGYIEMLAGTSRGIRLAEQFLEKEGLPLIGRVAAGEPILAEEHVEDHYKMDGSLFHPEADRYLGYKTQKKLERPSIKNRQRANSSRLICKILFNIR